ncbi:MULTISPECIES: hypothetical protein [Peribacillus]|uniref:Uncharacterized protein n=1 Tax=Peribacillus asahii TaxID=228899 RepID=A0A3Q9RLY7_9BACI|nr:hypothetical protein [Peribacillus asahii]AZV42591.1 hypothetical protein BAOM_1982 [Peribacillus asahii]USK61565.1 hypothetical protein LIT37_09725 [Peribacillus asahii]USK71988.1 hypothetical protein LIS76_09650 [Peribacillus asahii]USK86864.1 hypothetical protein LIT35_09615 [Peribacillus asahii]
METYREAYESYKRACENYGMESMTFYHFVTHLTKEQLNEYDNQAS